MPYDFKRYQTKCANCKRTTTRAFAGKNGGLCKSCVTGVDQQELFPCPDCGEKTLTAYQKRHHYHCDNCTRTVESGY